MNSEEYTVYIGNNCCCCNNIIQFISNNNLDVSSINIDNEAYTLPFSLMVIPALIQNKKLIAYGPDIITHLKNLMN